MRSEANRATSGATEATKENGISCAVRSEANGATSEATKATDDNGKSCAVRSEANGATSEATEATDVPVACVSWLGETRPMRPRFYLGSGLGLEPAIGVMNASKF